MTGAQLGVRLDLLDASLIGTIYRAWLGKGGAGDKVGRIAALAPLLSDRSVVQAAVGQWSAEHRLALSSLSGLRSPESGAMMAACCAAGVNGAPHVLTALLEVGALLPQAGWRGTRVHSRAIHETTQLGFDLNPAFALDEAPEPRAAPIRPVGGGGRLTIQLATPNLLATQVVRLAGLASRKRLRLNADGLPGGPLLAAARKELGGDAELPLMVTIHGGAVARRDNDLLPGGPDLHHLPLAELLHGLFGRFIASGGWRDDAAPGAAVASLRSIAWGQVSPMDCANVRIVLAGILRRLRTEDWVQLDAIVDYALGLDPLLGRRSRPGTSWGGRATLTASDQREQHALCGAVVVRTFHAFGIVDIACSDPPPSPWLVRVTALGRRLLDRRTPSVTHAGSEARIRVGADFEIVAPGSASPELVHRLDVAAVPLPYAPADPSRRWRLDRERWLSALAGGLAPGPLLEALATGGPLPENVLTTLAGWSAQYGRLTLHLDHDLVEGAPANLKGALNLGAGFAIVPSKAVQGTVLDVRTRDPRCLSLAVDDTLLVDEARADIRVSHSLGRFATPMGHGRWQFDRRLLLATSSAVVLATLDALSTAPLRPDQRLRVRAWCGEIEAGIDEVQVLQVPDAATFARMPELSPHVLGTLGPRLLLIAPGERAAVVEALAGLGVRVVASVQVEGGARS